MVLVNLMTCEEAVKTMKKASECEAGCAEECKDQCDVWLGWCECYVRCVEDCMGDAE